MRIDGQTLLSQPRLESSRITVVPVSALVDASDAPPAEIAKTVETLRAMGGMSARVLESGPGNMHVLDFSGTRITLKLAQSYAVGEMVAVVLASGQEAASAGDDVNLSSTGRLINAALTGDAREEAVTATKAAIVSDTAPADVPRLATDLRQAIQDTGIFYESHLATWVDGKSGLDDLRSEPKALLGQQQDPGDALSPQLSALVRRQLDALETRSVDWHGKLWPGQSGELAISEEPQAARGSTAKSWNTRVRLTLPHLGEVDAHISLSGNRVRLELDAEATSVSGLKNGSAQLRDALAARGLTAERFEVKSNV